MKVRIHQVAKDLDKTSQEVLEVLHELGVEDAKSHSSSIDESLVPKIKQRLSAHKKDAHGHHKVEAKVEPKKEHKPAHKVETKTHKVEHKPPEKVEHKTEHKPKVEHKAKTEHKPKVKEETAVEEVKPKKKLAAHPHRESAHPETAVAVAEPEVEETIPTPVEPSLSEEELERLTAPQLETVAPPVPEIPSRPKIQVSENIAVKDLAIKLNVMSKILLKKLLDRGILANLNQSLDLKLAEQLANEFGFDIEVK